MQRRLLTTPEVLKIAQQLATRSNQEIAKDLGVSTKIVSRIRTGDAWSNVTGIGTVSPSVDAVHRFTNPSLKQLKHANVLDIDPHNTHEVQATRVALASHLGLVVDTQWFWGRFRDWDGVISVVTDGTIAWISTKLADVFERLGYAELPTFPLEKVFTLCPGERVDPIYLNQRHAAVLKRMAFSLAEVPGHPNCAFMVHTDRRAHVEPSVHACVLLR